MAEQSTITVYALNGTNRKFTIPFEYLARRFVTVTLLGTSRTKLEITSGFRFLSANQIETTQAWGSAQGYTNIEIRRNTSATQRLVDFYDGSVLRSRDLNVSAIQTIHIAEEARNMAGETLAENIDGNLDARFRKVVNVQAGTVGGDAVNYGQMVAWSDSALNQANRAEAHADNAEVQAIRSAASKNAAAASQSAAKTSETNAKTSETNAAASQSASKTSETNAAASKSASKTSETNAAASQSASKTSETNSKASEVLSQRWAENPVNVPVVNGEFSAKHWAKKAEGFVGGENYLQVQNNLSDLSDVNAALENLGLSPEMVRNLSTPVGMCYTQYPNTPAPATLFGGTWKQLFNTEGVFFRTEGGGATGFEGGVQGDDNKSHAHTASTNNTGAHTHTLSGTAASAGSHTHPYTISRPYDVANTAGGDYIGHGQSSTARTGTARIHEAGAHTHSISGTANSAGGHAHTVTVVASGGSEARPKNRTIRVWQRTS